MGFIKPIGQGASLARFDLNGPGPAMITVIPVLTGVIEISRLNRRRQSFVVKKEVKAL